MKFVLNSFAKRIIIAAVFVTISAGAAGPLSAQKQETKIPPLSAGHGNLLKKTLCPDIAATDMKISLVSTEIGMPGIEFPRDRVKLTITIKNVGTAKAPSNFAIFLYKNDERIATLPTGTTDPGGGTWLFGYYDGFPHDVRTSYKVVAAPAFGECRTDNNEMSIAADEAKLHPAIALPDLVPVNKWPNLGEHGFCKLNNGKLEVTIKNQGAADAPLSTTKVALSSGKSVELPTSGIPRGGSAVLLIDLPENCFSCPDCSFTITADSYQVVRESDEGNNGAHGICYPY